MRGAQSIYAAVVVPLLGGPQRCFSVDASCGPQFTVRNTCDRQPQQSQEVVEAYSTISSARNDLHKNPAGLSDGLTYS